jgi:LacI family transcriptional regulator
MAATIKDVAKRAGVSQSTVSLVINNKANVSEETRRKVLKAIEELDYHPRHSARGLAFQRSGNIGFILREDHFSRAEQFYTRVFLGTEFEARNHEFYILLTTVSPEFRSSQRVPRFLLEHNVDGVILAGRVPAALVEYIRRMRLPVVFVDYYPRAGRFSAVLIDNLEGARQAVCHLLSEGHQKVAFLAGDLNHPSIFERFEGYKRALNEHGVAFDAALAVIDEPYPGYHNGYRAVAKLASSGKLPSAIFACNDAMAIGAMRWLKENGYRIPQDVAIVGFDDIDEDQHVEPHLTSVRVGKEEMGAMALRRLVEMISGKREIAGKVLLPVELVLRQSCGSGKGHDASEGKDSLEGVAEVRLPSEQSAA